MNLSSFSDNLSVVVIGASGGIGGALVKYFSSMEKVKKIYAFSRNDLSYHDKKVFQGHIDITDEDSISDAATRIDNELDIIIVASGILHGEGLSPEKSLQNLNAHSLQTLFMVNSTGPALVMKHFLPRIRRDEKAVFAALSARVGSLSENNLGGWYGYRASKSALNMFLKTAAIEMARKYKKAAVIGFHPGTVDTRLSKPFQNNVGHEIFLPEQAANYLISVIDQIGPEETGSIFAWDGQPIPY
jgi:NAD(P)-dependent dehydrogenase (short-subunit alcohol dehydrogenase family)